MIVDPRGCAAKIADVHGQAGSAWLARLPRTLAQCARRWSIEILPPFADLSYNYVAPAITAEGVPVVVKAGVPSDELAREIDALRVFNGHGIARLLEADPASGVMLLERLQPGEPLADLRSDEEITRAAASVMQQLWTPAPADHRFLSVRSWAAGLSALRAYFGGGYGPFPPDLVDTAQSLFAELLDPRREQTLIHGDPHPQNILSAERVPWLAIDPKGVVGDPLYDIATFACSVPRLPDESRQKRFLVRRLDQLADELSLDRRLIAQWALAQRVLSGWWSFEDHGGGWERPFALARLLESLLKG